MYIEQTPLAAWSQITLILLQCHINRPSMVFHVHYKSASERVIILFLKQLRWSM